MKILKREWGRGLHAKNREWPPDLPFSTNLKMHSFFFQTLPSLKKENSTLTSLLLSPLKKTFSYSQPATLGSQNQKRKRNFSFFSFSTCLNCGQPTFFFSFLQKSQNGQPKTRPFFFILLDFYSPKLRGLFPV